MDPKYSIFISACCKSSLQLGTSLGLLFIIHCLHYCSFKTTSFPAKIDKSDIMKYVIGELLNVLIPIYIFSYSSKMRELNFNNFRSYFNYFLKYVIPGIIYVVMAFIIGYLDEIPIKKDILSWYLPYRFIMIVIFAYQFVIGVIMYPIVSLLNSADKGNILEENIPSNDYFNRFVDDEYSEPEFSSKFVNSIGNPFSELKSRLGGRNSKLAYMISNILVYFFFMNIFYYFSLGYELYIIYTTFYVGIFIIYSVKYINKSPLSTISYTILVFFCLLFYIHSKIQVLNKNNGSMLFVSLFVFLTYFFVGYNGDVFNFIYGIRLYHIELFSLIPIIYERLKTDHKNIVFSPFHFPLFSDNGEFLLKITYSWIAIFLISYNLNYFQINRSINRKIFDYIEKIPYILILLSTSIFFIYERASILDI
ncbi:membrane associated protein [Cryptosporidium bovis]|uniref:membrane associated protein n=1 Tax=Cryptosporidium bovis TaxID=310047 RepID=UPI003519FE82|nr:membrane associated protein [Cryptosporidium bovis]